MKTVAIIQARVNSSRMPGKVLLPLGWNGERIPMWLYVYRQVSKAVDQGIIDRCVLAICEDSLKLHMWAWLGIEAKDVLYYDDCRVDHVTGRYWKAAVETEATRIVRITADCPLVQPEIIEGACTAFKVAKKKGYELVCTHTDYDGIDVEVFDLKSMVRWWKKDRYHLGHCEHVTSYAKEQGLVKYFRPRALAKVIPFPKLSVDTFDDWQRVRRICREFDAHPDMTLKKAIRKLQATGGLPNRYMEKE